MSYHRRITQKKKRPAKVSKGAKKLLLELGFEQCPSSIVGTGKNGNIIKSDVAKWLADQQKAFQEEE